MAWDPAQYGRYSAERNRPFFELLAGIGASAPGRVVDLGCGSGELTAALCDRWPTAAVLGIDSSVEMLERRLSEPADRPRFRVARAEDFDAGGTDVLISNALLQWVPGHRSLLTQWARQLNADGWLAFSVPANFDSPSHSLMRDLADSLRWRAALAGVLRHDGAVAEPGEYLQDLIDAELVPTVWQSTYLHVLPGPDPVFEWVSGTALRPALAALDPAQRIEFTEEYRQLLRHAYPQREFGTVLPFRRTFVVGHKQQRSAARS